ncbi:MAG: FMN-binding protein [Spirochaetes bacterium]|nr:FMN-binding protein [Spirochaetota bacterium]MBU0955626.1 FMN-binding protein [Spirochaetota bacterium]
MKKDSTLYVVIFTFVICAVFVSLLALANELTKERVAANRRFTSQSAILSALGISYSDPADAAVKFAAGVSEITDSDGSALYPPAWRGSTNGNDYIITQHAGAGLWGTITVMVAADPSGSEILGVRIIDQNETPGLGGRITEDWFLDQFRNLATAAGKIAIKTGAESGGGSLPPGTVDGITGATRTSDAMAPIINGALLRIRAISDGSALRADTTNQGGGK